MGQWFVRKWNAVWTWCRNVPWIFVMGFMVFAAWAVMLGLFAIAVCTDWFLTNEETAERIKTVLQQLGPLGDMFGAVTCLFTASAVIFTMRSYQLQHEETDRSRQLFDLQMEQSKQNAQAFAIQTQLNAFQILANYHQSRSEIKEDLPLKYRSRGRCAAYAELVERVSFPIVTNSHISHISHISHMTCTFDVTRELKGLHLQLLIDSDLGNDSSADTMEKLNRRMLRIMQILAHCSVLGRYGNKHDLVAMIEEVEGNLNGLHENVETRMPGDETESLKSEIKFEISMIRQKIGPLLPGV